MKDSLIRLGAAAMRLVFRRWPAAADRLLLWDRLVRPYIVWRHLPILARTRFHMAVRGNFPDLIHSYLYFFGVWEPGISRVIAHHLRSGDIAIDIGANVGAHTMLAASIVGGGGQVYAIEASPTIFRLLKDNLEYNRLNQVAALNFAVMDHAATVKVLQHSNENLGRTTIVPQQSDRSGAGDEAQVEGRPLAEIVAAEAIKGARLIKIDVEGAEWLVLLGMRELLTSLHDECIVLLEANADALAHFGVGVADIMALFRQTGWEVFEVSNSYNPSFYLRTPRSVLSTDIRTDASLLDLGFCRPAVLRQLLAAEPGWAQS